MTDTIPRTHTAGQAARARQCPLCQSAPGTPCQAKPPGDHLARYLDAYMAGQLTRPYMRAVVGELVVIDRAAIVAGACYVLEDGRPMPMRPMDTDDIDPETGEVYGVVPDIEPGEAQP